jgi:hypothetical protein
VLLKAKKMVINNKATNSKQHYKPTMPITIVNRCTTPSKTDTGYKVKGGAKMQTFDDRCPELDALLLGAPRKTLYEHVPSERRHKLYFDIDKNVADEEECKADAGEVLAEAVSLIQAVLPDIGYDQFYCTSLNGANLYTDKTMATKKYGCLKISYHIVIDNLTASNDENEAIAKYLNNTMPEFDTSVYSKNQLFRYGFCHKYSSRDAGCRSPQFWTYEGEGRFKPKTNATKLQIDETELRYKNLVSYITPEMCPVVIPEICQYVEPPVKCEEPTDYVLPDEADYDESFYKLLCQLPTQARDAYTPWFRITCLCKTVNKFHEWNKWCTASPSYDAEGNANTWKSITVDPDKKATVIPAIKKLCIKGLGDDLWELHQTWQRDTHKGHSAFLVKKFGKWFKCVDQEKGLYFRYERDTNLWIKCGKEALFTFIAKDDYSDLMKEYTNAIYESPLLFGFDVDAGDEDEQKQTKARMEKYITYLKTCEDTRTVSAWAKWFFPDDRIFDSEFERKLNQVHDHLSVANGMVNLRTGKLRPRTFKDKCSIALEMDYNEDAKPDGNEHWNTFIHSIFDVEGVDTEPVKEWVQNWMGYCVTGFTIHAMCCIWFGAGSNGKSLLQDLLINLLKTRHGNTINTWSSKLINEMSSSNESTNSHTAELAKMEHVRIGIINELGANTALDESFKKCIDSTDGLSVRASYGQPKTIDMTVVFNFLTNIYPQHPTSDAFRRRIRVVPMLAHFCEEDKMVNPNDKIIDYSLKHKIMQDDFHKQCVLSWLVKGAMEWFARDMQLPKEPKCCTKYKKQFISQMDYMSLFEYSPNKKDRVAMCDILDVIKMNITRDVPQAEITEQMFKLTKTEEMNSKCKQKSNPLKRTKGFTNLKIRAINDDSDSDDDEEETYGFK